MSEALRPKLSILVTLLPERKLNVSELESKLTAAPAPLLAGETTPPVLGSIVCPNLTSPAIESTLLSI